MSDNHMSLRGVSIGQGRSRPETKGYVYRGKQPWRPNEPAGFDLEKAYAKHTNWRKLAPTVIGRRCGTDDGFHEHLGWSNYPCDPCWDIHVRGCGRVKANRADSIEAGRENPVEHGVPYTAATLGCRCTLCEPVIRITYERAKQRKEKMKERRAAA